MKKLLLALSVILMSVSVAVPGEAQMRDTRWESEPLPPLVATDIRAAESRSRPLLRTAAALLGSAAGFAIAKEKSDGDPDDLTIPIAAGAAGGALGAMVFTNANPILVVLGSGLAALPAAALSIYLAGVLEDEEDGHYPLIAFSIPHGLLTSAFAQHRQ